jgi:WD40 repeat protein
MSTADAGQVAREETRPMRRVVAPDMPYKGLVPYSEQDADRFFGRDAERELVVANLLASRFTVLYGASGVGKSSLLRAGVLPGLREQAKAEQRERGATGLLGVLFSDWSGDPIAGLLEAIRTAARGVVNEDSGGPPAGATLDQALAWWTRRLGTDLLIVLDQFEEFFLYHEHENGHGSFMVELPRAVNLPDLRCNFLVSIREDAVARLDRFKGRIPALLQHTLRLRHLDRRAARAAIEQPLERYRQLGTRTGPVNAEPELVEAVLDEVRVGKVTLGSGGRGSVEPMAGSPEAPVETPYLQLVLTRLWTEESREGSATMRLATLRRLGSAERIVRTHLDEAMQTLPVEEQDIAAGVFRYLVTPSGTKISHTGADLAEYAELPEPLVAKVVGKLESGDARILRPVAPPLDRYDQPRHEIFHDVLAPAILDWRARHLERRRAEARLAGRLQAEAEAKRAAEERARAYRRTARITRAIAVATTLVLVLVTTLAILAWQGRQSALRARALSRSNERTAAALAGLVRDPAAALRWAAEAVQTRRTPQAELALRRALDVSRGRVVLHGHRDWVTGATFSGDGRFAVTTGNDETARVWDTGSGRQLAILKLSDQPNPLNRPQVSLDGSQVLVTGRDGKVVVWSWRQPGGRQMRLGAQIRSAALSRDGDLVVTGDDRGLQLWDARTGRARGSVRLRAAVNTVAFDRKGERVASGSGDGSVAVWTMGRARPVILPGDDQVGPVTALGWHPGGGRLVVGGAVGARLWDLRGARPRPRPLARDEGPVTRVAINGMGYVLAVLGKTVFVWNPRQEPVAQLRGHNAAVLDASFARQSTRVITASADGTGRVWEGKTGRALLDLRGHSDAVFGADFSPDGGRVVTAGADGTARIWDVRTGRILGQHRDGVSAASFSANGGRVVTAVATGTAEVWDAQGDLLQRFSTQSQSLVSAALNHDGSLLATGTGDGKAQLWRVGQSSRAPRAVLGFKNDMVGSLSFDGSDRILLTAAFAGRSEIWDWRGGRRTVLQTPRTATQGPVGVRKIFNAAFSPDGQRVVLAHADRTARLYDARNGRPERELQGHSGIVYSAAFSPDGEQVVTASGDGTARIWRAATGELVRTLPGQLSALRSAAFSPDGRRVVAGDADGATLIWDVGSGQVLGVLRRHTDSVNSTTFGRDGEILSASDDGTARLYPCDTCGPLDELLAKADQYSRHMG